MATGARRARPLRGRRHDRRGAGALDRLPRGGRRRQQPADEPRRRARAARARHPLRAGLPGQLRRADPRLARVARRPRDAGSVRCIERAMERLEPRAGDRRGRGLDADRGRRAAGARARRRPRGDEPAARGRRPAVRAPRLERAFEPVATRRTFEEAVEQIAEKVKSGELHVGDRLPSERDLAAQMRISRPTLREAVKVLAEAGVLEVRRGQAGGIFVASRAGAARAAAQPPGDARQRGGRACSRPGGCSSRAWPSSPPSTPSEDDFAAMQDTIERQRELAGERRLPAPRGPVPRSST